MHVVRRLPIIHPHLSAPEFHDDVGTRRDRVDRLSPSLDFIRVGSWVYSAAQMINNDCDAGTAVCQIRQARQAREVGRPVVVAQVILLQPRKPRKKGLVEVRWKSAANTPKVRTCCEMRRQHRLHTGAQPEVRR